VESDKIYIWKWPLTGAVAINWSVYPISKPVTLNVELSESAESSPMQYNNSGLKLLYFGK